MGYVIVIGFCVVMLIYSINYQKKRKALFRERQLANPLENITKEFKIQDPAFEKTTIQIDEPNKKFSVDYEVFNFKDLLDFDYKLDGETIISGKGLSTVAGGVTFGLLGAMAGASGKRKQKEKIRKATLILRMDSLERSNINIEILPAIAKSSQIEDLISAFKYIKVHSAD